MNMVAKVIYKTAVREQWLDYNGHMNDAYYAVVFSEALDALMTDVGMDAAYRDKTSNSLFTLQAQICYLHEALLGETMYVDCQLLGFDRKRLHVFFNLYKQGCDTLLATSEQMLLHVDMKQRKGAVFDAQIGPAIVTWWQQQAGMPRPHQAGRSFMALNNSL